MRERPKRTEPILSISGLCAIASVLWLLGACHSDEPRSASEELGLAARVARAGDPGADACGRVTALADQVRARLGEVDRAVPGLSASIKAGIARWAPAFGPPSGLLLGEVHRVFAQAMADKQIDPTELGLLAGALDQHARMAGVALADRQALRADLLGPFQVAPGAQDAALRNGLGQLALDLAHLFSDLQQCSPK